MKDLSPSTKENRNLRQVEGERIMQKGIGLYLRQKKFHGMFMWIYGKKYKKKRIQLEKKELLNMPSN